LSPKVDYSDLVSEIEQVLRNKNPSSQNPDEPQVKWEKKPYVDRIHVTVIWNKWESVGLEARGRVILDAIERAEGIQTVQKVGMALGVTPEQAQRMGITW
jgi:hypothetical protein